MLSHWIARVVVIVVIALRFGPLAMAQEEVWREHAEAGREAHEKGNLRRG